VEAVKLFALADLRERDSVRFPLGPVEGFAVRVGSEVRAYVNVCPHRAQPVDVGDGRLWVGDGIECQAHGARFDPLTGSCAGGPCDGTPLSPLSIEERDGAVWLTSAASEPRW